MPFRPRPLRSAPGPAALDGCAEAVLPPEVEAVVRAMPKVDLHVHAEAAARLDRVRARRQGRPAHDWAHERDRLMAEVPPGPARLARLNGDLDVGALEALEALDSQPEWFVARIADALEQGAAGGALLVEQRFGRGTVLVPDFMARFREAERRAQARYPSLRAEAIVVTFPHDGREDVLEGCLRAAHEGLAGIDCIATPYDAGADWAPIARWAARAAGAGLGITVHAGEFAAADVAAALSVPGVRRIGHAVHAAHDPRLLDALARSGVTVECCLTSNVVLGAVESWEAHPIRTFVAHGVPVTLNTDDPVRLATSIGREYALAAALGFSADELLAFTRNAVNASFTSSGRCAALLDDLRVWEAAVQAG